MLMEFFGFSDRQTSRPNSIWIINHYSISFRGLGAACLSARNPGFCTGARISRPPRSIPCLSIRENMTSASPNDMRSKPRASRLQTPSFKGPGVRLASRQVSLYPYTKLCQSKRTLQMDESSRKCKKNAASLPVSAGAQGASKRKTIPTARAHGRD
jgi:hypothetical protein